MAEIEFCGNRFDRQKRIASKLRGGLKMETRRGFRIGEQGGYCL
jgi:hypothetical protein